MGARASRTSEVIRAVLDTNVVISALLFSGPASRLVSTWQAGRVQPVVSLSILDEYLRVLAYPKFRLTGQEIHGLLQEELLPFVETVRLKGPRVTLTRDPEDAKFVECALAGAVPWIVSGDADLLDLHHIESIRIITVTSFLTLLKRHR